MAKVTYRGVTYDTNDKKSCQKEASVLTYRGKNCMCKVSN